MGEIAVIDIFLEFKDFPDSTIQRACNGALWNIKDKLMDSPKYQTIGYE